jgi:hypothetical protein
MMRDLEPNGAAKGVVQQAVRWQRDRILALVDRSGSKHLTVTEIAHELKWPVDSALHWVDELLDAEELEITELVTGGIYRVKRSLASDA